MSEILKKNEFTLNNLKLLEWDNGNIDFFLGKIIRVLSEKDDSKIIDNTEKGILYDTYELNLRKSRGVVIFRDLEKFIEKYKNYLNKLFDNN